MATKNYDAMLNFKLEHMLITTNRILFMDYITSGSLTQKTNNRNTLSKKVFLRLSVISSKNQHINKAQCLFSLILFGANFYAK